MKVSIPLISGKVLNKNFKKVLTFAEKTAKIGINS